MSVDREDGLLPYQRAIRDAFWVPRFMQDSRPQRSHDARTQVEMRRLLKAGKRVVEFAGDGGYYQLGLTEKGAMYRKRLSEQGGADILVLPQGADRLPLC